MGVIDSAINQIKTNGGGPIGPCICVEADTDAASDMTSDSESSESSVEATSVSDSSGNRLHDIKRNASLSIPMNRTTSFDRFVSSDVEPVPSDLQTLQDAEQNADTISPSSKKMMRLAYIIASALSEYFESAANQCEFGDIAVQEILQHIHITGDWPRNYLLGLATDDNRLDIIVNTRELAKIHLKHLQQHHSTEEQQTSYSQCILWNHYMNKLDADAIQQELALRDRYKNNAEKIANAMMSIEYISKCAYILNAMFITSTLAQAQAFENKLSIYRDPNSEECASYHMQVIDELQSDDISLNGTNFHIFDAHQRFYVNVIMNREKHKERIEQFHGLQRNKLIVYRQDNNTHRFMEDMMKMHDKDQTLHMRLSTRRVFDPSDITSVNAFKRIDFTIPKYKHS
eukprot:315504_1